MGLNDKLKLAATDLVVEKLLLESIGFKEASPKTKRRWRYVATRRLKDIRAAHEKQTVSERKTEKSAKNQRA